MIFATKDTITAYKGISERIDTAIDFVLSLDKDIPCGRHEIDGDRIYANVMCGETTPINELKFEAHKKYLDLQYIIEGEETMVHAMVSDCKAETEYDSQKDIYLLSGDGNEIKVKAGYFYLVHPFDAHAPGKGHSITKYKKVIVKILI